MAFCGFAGQATLTERQAVKRAYRHILFDCRFAKYLPFLPFSPRFQGRVRMKRVIVAALLVCATGYFAMLRAEPGQSGSPDGFSVTVVPFQALGDVKKSVSEVISAELDSQISVVVQRTVSTGSLNADAFVQSCGAETCEKKTTHRVRGSIGNLGSKYLLNAQLETSDGKNKLFTGKRDIPQDDDSLISALADLARDIVECLQGKNCKDEPWGGGEAPMPGVAAAGGGTGIRGTAAPVDKVDYGTLRVNSRPQGAEVYVDGELKGKTPLAVPRIEAGDRTVIIHSDGFADSTEAVTVRANQTMDLSKALAELTGKLEVTTTPPDAQVFIDDKYVGQSPYKNPAIRTGNYKVALKLKNFADGSATATVEANRTARVDERLKGLPGKIVVSTTPAKATVFVDGNEAGKSLYSGPAEPGTHKIRVSLNGYQDGEKEVEVKPGQSAAATFTLEEAPKGYAGGGSSGGMVTIPAGNFLYGDDKKSVYLAAFKIDRTEVTVADYARCVQAGKCTKPDSSSDPDNWGKPGRENHPVNDVNWNDAKAYCEWAGKRLPSEQEWEKAARGTDGRTYPWGEQEPTCDRTILDEGGLGCGKNGTWPVCSKPNGNSPYGLCDMTGNVWEWTADWYTVNETRVLRGGSWSDDGNMTFFRAGDRSGCAPADLGNNLGFRCAQ